MAVRAGIAVKRRRRGRPRENPEEGDVFVTLAGDELDEFQRHDLDRDLREMQLAAGSRVFADRRRAF